MRDPDGTRRKEVLIPNIADFEQRWNKAVAALESAIKVLRHPQEFGAISSQYLPYVSILPVFAALQSHLKTMPPQSQLDAQRKIDDGCRNDRTGVIFLSKGEIPCHCVHRLAPFKSGGGRQEDGRIGGWPLGSEHRRKTHRI